MIVTDESNVFVPAFSLQATVCVCTVCVSLRTSDSSQLHPPTNILYITVGTIQSTNLPSVFQSEQLLPQRNKMSPIEAFIRHIMYHPVHCTLSASSLSVSPAWRRSLSFVKTAPCKQQEAAVIAVPLDFTSIEAGKQLWGNGMDRGKKRGGRKCEALYFTFSKCHRAVVTSMFMQPKSVHCQSRTTLSAVCMSFKITCPYFKGHLM